jgi:hypothetical protein
MLMFPRDQSANPLVITFTRERLNRVEPSLDLVSWKIGGPVETKSEFLPVCIGRGPFVAAGDRVMAVGFRINKAMRAEGRAMVTFQEELCGSIGTVIEVHSDWNQDTGVWPRLVVDGFWPSGMSGGPVFNEIGTVVGIFSRGAETWSQALWIQKLPFNAEIFPGSMGKITRELAERRSAELAARCFRVTVVCAAAAFAIENSSSMGHYRRSPATHEQHISDSVAS